MLYYFGSVLIGRKGVFLLHFKSVHARIEELLKGISGVAFEMNEMLAFILRVSYACAPISTGDEFSDWLAAMPRMRSKHMSPLLALRTTRTAALLPQYGEYAR